MDQLTKDMNAILNHIDKNRWIAFSKDDTPDRFKAKDKLRALNLIERRGKLSWQLTEVGYKAIELGGFHNWIKEKEGNKQNQKLKAFLVKFWWTFVIPLIVALIIWALPTIEKNDSKGNLQSETEAKNEKESNSDKGIKYNNPETISLRDQNKYYLQSYRPIELFDGKLIITLNNIIEYVNQDIDLKIISKDNGETIITKGKKIGDLIEFGSYLITFSSLERNISTYDLVIKVESKIEKTGANKK